MVAKYNITKELFAKRLKTLMNDNNETTYSLGEILNLSAATISRYRDAKMSPKITTIQAMAKYFNVNPAWLMGYDVEKNLNVKKELNLTDNEINILNKYNSLDEKGKHTVNTVLNMEYNRCNNEICATAMVAESYDEYMPIAAHNDFADNLEEQRLMQEDLDEL